MSDFGLHLKQARERRGISLRQIATSTKISTVALEALERGDFSRLPGGIFSRAFVRAYADEVGLDPEETVRQYTELADAAAASSELESSAAEITDDDRAFLERQRKAGKWLQAIGVMLLIAVGGGIGYWRYTVSRSKAPAVQVITEPVAPPVSAPPVTTPAPTTTTATEPATEPAAAVPSTVSVQLRATASCWVQVTADGRLVLSRNLTAGESQTFVGEKEVTLQLGNAGAIEWMINGKPAKPLGAVGDVKKTTITPDTAAQFIK